MIAIIIFVFIVSPLRCTSNCIVRGFLLRILFMVEVGGMAAGGIGCSVASGSGGAVVW